MEGAGSTLPRPRTRHKSKRATRHASAILIIALIAASVVVGYSSYGLTYRPLVDYTFGAAKDLRKNYRLQPMSPFQPSTIDITQVLVENTGSSDITVIVTLQAVNAVVSTSYYGPFNNIANIQIHLPVASGYRLVTFYLTLPAQVPFFSIHIAVSRVLDFSSLASSAETAFALIQPTPPTQLVYTNIGTNPYVYELTQQS